MLRRMRALPWLLLGVALGLFLLPGAAAEPLDIVLRPLEDACDTDEASPCWETPVHVVPLGAQVALRLDREGAQMPHNLHVLEPVHEATPVEFGGVSEPIVLVAAEVGRIEFLCDVHPDTMYGWLEVQHPRVIAGELDAAFSLVLENGSRVVVDASATKAAPGATYHWDFGDGATAEGVKASFTYETSDQAEVRLTVREPDGAIDTTWQGVVLSYSWKPRYLLFRALEDGCPGASPCWRGWPAEVEVFAGEWLAADFWNSPDNAQPHSLRFIGGPSFPVREPNHESETLALGQATRTLTFVCDVHPQMTGTIRVLGATDAAPEGDADAAGEPGKGGAPVPAAGLPAALAVFAAAGALATRRARR
jgi:hypothetical protein